MKPWDDAVAGYLHAERLYDDAKKAFAAAAKAAGRTPEGAAVELQAERDKRATISRIIAKHPSNDDYFLFDGATLVLAGGKDEVFAAQREIDHETTVFGPKSRALEIPRGRR